MTQRRRPCDSAKPLAIEDVRAHRTEQRTADTHGMPSSPPSSSSKAKRSGGLQGPRPQPLSLSTRPPPSKKPRVRGGGDVGGGSAPAGPVIVYERTPRVVHARRHEFMAVVQRLTGRQQQQPSAFPGPAGDRNDDEATVTAAADPLVLTLGQQPPPCDDHSATCPSPSAALLMSPSSFLFSPATVQAIRELIS